MAAAHYSLLIAVHVDPGLAGAELARRLNVTPQAVASLVTRLEGRGQLERRPRRPTQGRRRDRGDRTADHREARRQGQPTEGASPSGDRRDTTGATGRPPRQTRHRMRLYVGVAVASPGRGSGQSGDPTRR
ncbi:MarR family transcriptional regulator [Streptomyces viridochromogenes]|uniref:MarR family transcriptional regulator n=1 Tax=Streptomyces viridochromogenes TaxID=1938 RepID=UPI001F37B175|nr:helix-turn-helix domain-containing protein [Streptomyces viridochromogenes]